MKEMVSDKFHKLGLFVRIELLLHTAQMKEMAYIGFYVWYFLEWLLCLLVSGFSFGYAYHDISLEEEAHLNDKDLEYLKTRKHYSWWSYIKLGSWKKNKN